MISNVIKITKSANSKFILFLRIIKSFQFVKISIKNANFYFSVFNINGVYKKAVI